MKITKLSFSNFKGSTASHDLAPVTAVTGRNFSGKSTVVEALQLALGGFLPGLDRRPNVIFDTLASGNPMTVEAELDGNVIRWDWKKEKGSVKCTSTNSVFKHEAFPTVALDLSEFLSLSGPARVRFLFERGKLGPEFGVEALAKSIAENLRAVSVDAPPKLASEAVDLLVGFVSKRPPATPQEWLAALVEDVKQRRLAAAATVERMAHGQQALTQVSDGEPAPPDAEDRLAKARAVLEVAVRAHADLQSSLRSASMDLDAAEALAAQFVDEDSARAALAELERKVEADQKATPPPNGPETLDALNKATRVWNATRQQEAVAKAEVVRLEKEIDTAKANKAACPKCGHNLNAGILKSLKQSLLEAKLAHEGAVEAFNVAAEALHDAEGHREEWMKLEIAYHLRQSELTQANYNIASIKEQLAANTKAREAREQLPGLKETAAITRQKFDAAQAEVSTAREAVATAEAQARRLVAQRAEERSRAQVQEQAQRAKAELAVLKELAKILTDLQAQLVARTVGPILATANELCGGVLPYPLVFDEDNIWFDLGGGKRMACKRPSCSGTQEALAHAALSVALAADAPIRLVILDELGRLDDGNKAKVLALLCELEAAGKIDQALVVDTAPLARSDKNFKCIRL